MIPSELPRLASPHSEDQSAGRAKGFSFKRRLSIPEGARVHVLSLAVLRVMVASSFLISELYRFDYGLLIESSRDLPWHPRGILLLFAPQSPPSLAAVEWVRMLGVLGTLCYLIGLGTLVSGWISFAANYFLAALLYGFEGHASHEYHVLLLCQAVILLAPAGAVFSADHWLRKRLRPNGGDSVATPENAFRVPVWAVVFLIGWMFFNAFMYKMAMGGGLGFNWVFTDNMRNILGFQQAVLGRAYPEWLRPIGENPLLFKSFALGNMAMQAMSLGGALFLQQPRLRLLCGLLFIGEVLGLGFVMGRWDISPWNPHWLVLLAAYVHWDYFLRRSAPLANVGPSRKWHPASVWALAVVIVEVIISFAGFVFPLDKAYPFSPFAMYANVHAKQPFSEHQSYNFLGPVWTAESYGLQNDPATRRLAYLHSFGVESTRHLPHLEARVRQQAVKLERGLRKPPGTLILYSAIYSVPPYPGAPEAEVLSQGMRAILDSSGEFRAVTAAFGLDPEKGPYIEIISKNLGPEPDFQVRIRPVAYTYYEPLGVLQPTLFSIADEEKIQGEWVGKRFFTEGLEPGASYIVVVEASLRNGARRRFWSPILTAPPLRAPISGVLGHSRNTEQGRIE